MIPKTIHYFWFGNGEKTKLAKKCIASWKQFCPDYQIVEWNESNFDVNMNAYTKMCYDQKKYAFLTDYARLLIVREHGGIYFDTDVEVVKSLDDLLLSSAFFGFEDSNHVNTGEGFGAEANCHILDVLISEYDALLDGEHGYISCPKLNTSALAKIGMRIDGTRQSVDGVEIYPVDFFNPYDDPTGRMNKTANTYSIHWYGKSWLDKKTVLRSKMMRPIHRLLGKDFFHKGDKR